VSDNRNRAHNGCIKVAHVALAALLSISITGCIGHRSTSVPPRLLLDPQMGAPSSFHEGLRLATAGKCIAAHVLVLSDKRVSIASRISFVSDLFSISRQTGANFDLAEERDIMLYAHAYSMIFPGKFYVDNRIAYEKRSINHIKHLLSVPVGYDNERCFASESSLNSCIINDKIALSKRAINAIGKLSSVNASTKQTQCVWGNLDFIRLHQSDWPREP
jgi:hypothetical protein